MALPTLGAPSFWQRDGAIPRLLSPLSSLVAAGTARRVSRPGWRAPVPVICCGNPGVGGAGKTPLALDFGQRLGASGKRVAFLTRGHGGTSRGVLRVDAGRHEAALVGDEALLLARLAPTYVARDRALGARAAVADGAEVLVMDDGLQNPSLAKDMAVLVVDGGAGFGNGRVLPAGPLREPVAAAAARCQAAVLIGPDRMCAAAQLAGLPLLAARLVTRLPSGDALGPALAFAGIGRPQKFFDGLREAGALVVEAHPFPDHHPYRRADIERLRARADGLGLALVTTEKDAVRLPPDLRARLTVATAALEWEDPDAPDRLLAPWL